MYIISCLSPGMARYPYAPQSEKREIVFTLRKYLCMMYELAMDERTLVPSRPYAALRWFRSSFFFRDFHEYFHRLEEFEVETESQAGQRCQICSLMNALRMVALSRFSGKCDAFIARTTGDTPIAQMARINFDWAAAFAEFFVAAKLPIVFRSAPQRIIRAIRICNKLNDICDGDGPHLAEPAAPYPSSPSADDEDAINHALARHERWEKGKFRIIR